MPTMMFRRRSPAPTTITSESPVMQTLERAKVRVRTTVLCTSAELEELRAKQPCNAVADKWSEENMNSIRELWKLSPEDESRLRDLQHRLQDIDHFKNDPHIVLRYMFAPTGYKAAESQFRKMIEWRRDNDIDSLLTDYKPPQLLLDYNFATILKGLDREHDPIYVERGGACDAQGFLKHFTKEEVLLHAIWMRELNTQGAWLDDYEQRQGHKVKDITVVYDLKGLNSRHLTPKVIDMFAEIMKMTGNNYPGPIKRMIVIRCPAFLRVAWSLVKHIFPKCAQDKMIFAGKANYLKVLDKYIDLNVLPPCIYEEGRGEPAIGMPPRLEGGVVPEDLELSRDDCGPLTGMSNASSRTYCMFDSFDGTEPESITDDQSDLSSNAELF